MIRLALANPWSAPIFFVEETASTMDDAAALADQGFPDGTTVTAGVQIQGRGRFVDRTWLSPPRENLLFTFFLGQSQIPPSRYPLSLRIGLGLTDFIRSLDLPAQLKWPNDVLIGDRKTAGILVIARRGFCHIGIGLNLNQINFPSGTRLPPTSLRLAGRPPRDDDPIGLLPDLLTGLKAALAQPDHHLADELQTELWGVGQTITLRTGLQGQQEWTGRLLGIGDSGEALLEIDGQIQRLFSAE